MLAGNISANGSLSVKFAKILSRKNFLLYGSCLFGGAAYLWNGLLELMQVPPRLDLVEKVFAWVIQERLHVIAECVLS